MRCKGDEGDNNGAKTVLSRMLRRCQTKGGEGKESAMQCDARRRQRRQHENHAIVVVAPSLLSSGKTRQTAREWRRRRRRKAVETTTTWGCRVIITVRQDELRAGGEGKEK
jgi:hypothetical protein